VHDLLLGIVLAQATPGTLALSPSSLALNPAQQQSVTVSGATPPLQATLDQKLVTVAVAQDGRSVTVRVRNTGSRSGRDVVQAYLAPVESDAQRPARALGGFSIVEAAPGETATATITLPRRAFDVWDENRGAWTHRSGAYDVRVGPSSALCPLSVRIEAVE